MRTIPVRQFQRNFYSELRQAPFVVTRQNPKTREDEPVFIVEVYRPDHPVLKEATPPQHIEQSPTLGESVSPPTVSVENKPNFLGRLFGKK